MTVASSLNLLVFKNWSASVTLSVVFIHGTSLPSNTKAKLVFALVFAKLQTPFQQFYEMYSQCLYFLTYFEHVVIFTFK